MSKLFTGFRFAAISFIFLFMAANAQGQELAFSVSLVDSRQRFYTLSQGLKEKDVIIFFMEPDNQDDLKVLSRLNELYATYEENWDILAIGTGAFDREAFFDFARREDILFHVAVEREVSGLENIAYEGKRSFFLASEAGGIIPLEAVSYRDIVLQVTERLYQKGEYETACSVYSDLLDRESGSDFRIISGLAYCNLAAGDFEESKRWFEALLKADKTSGLLGLAYYHFAVADFSGMNEYLSEAAKDMNAGSNVLFYLLPAETAWHEGNAGAARAGLQRAIYAKADHPWIKARAFNLLGLLYIKNGQTRKGMVYLDKALMENPYSADAIGNKAMLYFQDERIESARKNLARIPENFTAGIFLRDIEEWKKAGTDKKEKERMDFILNKAAGYYKRGQWKKPLNRFDPWTSVPLTVYLKEFSGDGLSGLGMGYAAGKAVYNKMADSGRIKTIPSYAIKEAARRLNLTSGEAGANARQIAGSFGARFILGGRVEAKGMGLVVYSELSDVATGETVLSFMDEIGYGDLNNMSAHAFKTAATLTKGLERLYPLQAKIAAVDDGGGIIINIGERHGVRPGMEMVIYRDTEPVLKNGAVRHTPVKTGRAAVTSVERDISRARIISGSGFLPGYRLGVSPEETVSE